MKRMHHFIKSLAFIALFVSAMGAQASELSLTPFQALTSPSTNSGGFVADFPVVVGDTYTLSKTFAEIEELTLDTSFSGNSTPTLITFQEIIFNNTGTDWTDFHIQLFPDTETTISGLSVVSAAGDAFTTAVNGFAFGNLLLGTAGFTEIAFPFASSSVSTNGLELNLFNGLVADGDVFTLTYSFLISGVDNTQTFSISQAPTIPEPAGLALLGLGLVGLGISRRSKMH